MVLTASESAIRHQVNGLFQKFHIKPNIVLESKSIITATDLALRGVGLHFFCQHTHTYTSNPS